MHPDLLNNSIFLRYYNQWQENPASVVFAPIAEYLQIYKMADEAILVCQEGLKHHPQSVSGRLALAKAFIQKKELGKAREQLKIVLNLVPKQEKAMELLGLLEKEISPQEMGRQRVSWETVTMAKIYAAQGHADRAREVYQSILQREPANQDAIQGLALLESEG